LNHDRYREHTPIRGSLRHVVGDDASDADYIRRQAREAWHQRRGLWLSEEDLKAMPTDLRLLIEVQGRRIYGPRQQNGG